MMWKNQSFCEEVLGSKIIQADGSINY